jgi:hypothetical protein
MQLSHRIKRALWITLPFLAILALGALGYAYRIRLKVGLDFLVEETGSRTMAALCLILALFTLVCLLLWMLFPLLVYLGLKDLRRRTSELDETTRVCARHLARLADDRIRPQANTMTLPSPARAPDEGDATDERQ